MSTAVVTGGAGFLGSHLCEHLLEKGYRVLCVDNLETSSLANIGHIRDDAFTFVNHDVIEHIEIDGLIDLDVLDHVVVQERERVVANVLDVPQRAGLEVVHADNAVTLLEQVIAKVRAEEPGSAGDYCGGHEGAG